MLAAIQTELRSEIGQARAHTDRLFSLVKGEAAYSRPIPERHRLIFYLGHLEAFDWNLLREPLGLASFHPELDRLFAFGIDPPEGALPADQPSDWPSLEETRAYNRQIREQLDAALERLPAGEAQRLHVALEHRWMHAETFAYLLHNVPLAGKNRPPDACIAHPGVSPPEEMAEIPAGEATLGRRREEAGFGWDNEFEQCAVRVNAFAIRKCKVTNADYLEFVCAGGPPPPFWVRRDGAWMLRAMFDEIPLPSGWPVYATHEQASAYAAWKGKRLPSEPEFHRAAFGTPGGNERPYPWGDAPPDASASEPSRGNFDFAAWDPVPVTSHPDGDSAFGVSQLVGNGWEWTSTPFAPFPGFRIFDFYPGYSANFFDGQHYVLKGGSPRTAACLLRSSFRNWFRPRYPYIYATFRYVEVA